MKFENVRHAVDAHRLDDALEREFGSTDAERRVVVRQARDLADSGMVDEDRGHELTVDDVLGNLDDAPADLALAQKWNWWMGALETAFGGYLQFTVRTVADEQ